MELLETLASLNFQRQLLWPLLYILYWCPLFKCWCLFFFTLQYFPRKLYVLITARSPYILPAFYISIPYFPHVSSCPFSISIFQSQINQNQHVPSRGHLSLKTSSSVYFNKWHCYFYANSFLLSVFLSILFPLLRLYFWLFCWDYTLVC